MNDEEKRLKLRKDRLEIIQALIVIFFMTLGVIAGVYIGPYLMLIKSVLECISAFNNGILNESLIIWSTMKILLSCTVGWTLFGLNWLIALKIARQNWR